jgi:hypothetical protein
VRDALWGLGHGDDRFVDLKRHLYSFQVASSLKMALVQGGNASFLFNRAWLGPWRKYFDDESWRGSDYSSRASVCLYSVPVHVLSSERLTT